MRPDGGGMPFPLILGTLGWHFRARRIVDEGAEIKSDEITALDARDDAPVAHRGSLARRE